MHISASVSATAVTTPRGASSDPAIADRWIATFEDSKSTFDQKANALKKYNEMCRDGSLKGISEDQLRALSKAMSPFLNEINAVHEKWVASNDFSVQHFDRLSSDDKKRLLASMDMSEGLFRKQKAVMSQLSAAESAAEGGVVHPNLGEVHRLMSGKIIRGPEDFDAFLTQLQVLLNNRGSPADIVQLSTEATALLKRR